MPPRKPTWPHHPTWQTPAVTLLWPMQTITCAGQRQAVTSEQGGEVTGNVRDLLSSLQPKCRAAYYKHLLNQI
jgi:hypothetical protein